MAKKTNKDKKYKDKKSKRKSVGAACSNTAAPSMPMFMMMPPQPPAAAPVAESSDASSSSSDEPAEDDKNLHRGATTLLKMPKVRLQQLVEAVDPALDSCTTADMGPEDLCRIIWMTTRMKPTAKLVSRNPAPTSTQRVSIGRHI